MIVHSVHWVGGDWVQVDDFFFKTITWYKMKSCCLGCPGSKITKLSRAQYWAPIEAESSNNRMLLNKDNPRWISIITRLGREEHTLTAFGCYWQCLWVGRKPNETPGHRAEQTRKITATGEDPKGRNERTNDGFRHKKAPIRFCLFGCFTYILFVPVLAIEHQESQEPKESVPRSGLARWLEWV
jgi:hypothetical protein